MPYSKNRLFTSISNAMTHYTETETMSTKLDIPFNISLLNLTPEKLRSIRKISTLDDFVGNTNVFHPDGLYSPEIFGKVGDELRNRRFSYIDIKVPIFHPVIYNALVDLKRLYGGIINGSEYVLWNDEIKDFERSNPLSGKSGFAYFMQYWEDIVFKKNNSVEREQNIELIEKHKKIATTSKVVVMPAGLRDMEIGDDGRNETDEINTLYRKLLSISNGISDANLRSNTELINNSRLGLQMTFNAIYDQIIDMVKGKKKLLLGKWASRRVFNGTRNVITSMDTSMPILGSDGAVGVNNTVMGLYQALKSIMPVARYHIKTGFLSKVFIAPNMPVKLVNKKTLKSENVVLNTRYFDKWMTDEGIEKIITSFQEERLRDLPLEIEGHYMGLIYKGPDMTFKLMQDIDELPEGMDKSDVYPLTFCELLYASTYVRLKNVPVIVTRYPIAGVGSTYCSMMYVRTTVKSEVRKELSESWSVMDKQYVAHSFPIAGSYLNSLVPHPSKVKGMVADYDGDVCSATALYSDESIAEVKNYLASREAYVGVDGRLKSSIRTDTTNFVMHNLTK